MPAKPLSLGHFLSPGPAPNRSKTQYLQPTLAMTAHRKNINSLFSAPYKVAKIPAPSSAQGLLELLPDAMTCIIQTE